MEKSHTVAFRKKERKKERKQGKRKEGRNKQTNKFKETKKV